MPLQQQCPARPHWSTRVGMPALTAMFALFLYPVTVGSVSVNYTFALLPFVVVASTWRMKRVPPAVSVPLAVFVLILPIAGVYQFDQAGALLRRLASFAVFVSVFSYAFIDVDRRVARAVKMALAATALLFALRSEIVYMLQGGDSLGSSAKDIVGSQRFGFIYIVALWLTYLNDVTERPLPSIVRGPMLLCLSAALLLTFSRASVVTAAASLCLFVLVDAVRQLRRLQLNVIWRTVRMGAVGAAVLAVLYLWMPSTFTFFEQRLVGLVSDQYELQRALTDSYYSEGARIFLAQRIGEYILWNPFTGSGYLGVWILPEISAAVRGATGAVGSAHNQYLDVLFRTGIVGFLAYLWLLWAVMRCLWRSEPALFWGAVGVLIYGCFHETFKESQGAFLLAFWVGLMAHDWRNRRVELHGRLAGSPSFDLSAAFLPRPSSSAPAPSRAN